MSFPLYLDEHVDVELAALLTCGGLAVLTTQDAELSNKKTPDLDQLTFATQRRAILTHYIKDYVALSKQWAEEGRHHSGILLCSQRPVWSLYAGILRLQEDYPDGMADICMGGPHVHR